VKQRDDFSCGPIALFHLALWTNKVSKLNYRQLKYLCHVSNTQGTHVAHFERALQLFAPSCHISPPTQELSNCEAGILLYHWENLEDFGNHYCFFIKSKEYFLVANFFDPQTKKYVCKQTFKQLPFLTKYRFTESSTQFNPDDVSGNVYPQIWLITKKNLKSEKVKIVKTKQEKKNDTSL